MREFCDRCDVGDAPCWITGTLRPEQSGRSRLQRLPKGIRVTYVYKGQVNAPLVTEVADDMAKLIINSDIKDNVVIWLKRGKHGMGGSGAGRERRRSVASLQLRQN